MLPASARLTDGREFSATTRRGRRAGRARLVMYLRTDGDHPARVGFVVSKAVGNAVVRHRVTRQLRHVLRARLDRLPNGASVVVRALPPAAGATSAELARDVDGALGKLGLDR